MKALFYPSWNKLEITERRIPTPGPGEVLIRVSHCGICGSELETFRSKSTRRQPPLVMGHEYCGRVADAGPGVSDWKLGDRVISHALVHCGKCFFCQMRLTNLCESRKVFGMHLPGAFAEFVVAPTQALFSWPKELTADTAVLAEPLANGVNALRLDPAQSKQRVVVIGAGPIGLMCIAAARALYDSTVIAADLVPERLEAAASLGATAQFNPKNEEASAVLQRTWGLKFADYVIDAVGSASTKRLSLDIVRPGGTAVWVGLHDSHVELDTYPITLQQKRVLGSYSGSVDDVEEAIKILAAGAVNARWAKVFPLEDGVNGFFKMLEGKGDNIKGILDLS